MKGLFNIGAFALLMLAGQFGQGQALYRSGTHYEVVSNEAPSASRQVTEFFWYGCSGCYAFEPVLKQWHEERGAEVDFRRTPAVWSDAMLKHARIFFAEEELGVLAAHHQAVFDEIHLRRKNLVEEDEVLAFFAARGVDGDAFQDALSSFGVDSRLRKSQSEQRALRIASVPSLVVNGKYLVSANAAVRTPEEVLRVVDYLLGLEDQGASE